MATQTTPHRVERLRADIDRGRTGDKVSALDPAAAPLGADDEAAGTPLSQEQLAICSEHEAKIGERVAASKNNTGPIRSFLIAGLVSAALVVGMLFIVY
ncbi:MAG: hypothetical protein AB7H77_07815 [Bdellovibrionales bacterium]